MAYDASNLNNNQSVAGANPLSEPSPNNAQSSQNAPSEASQPMQAPTPQNSSQAPKKASSGMFTNIQKYVGANQPQAQKMGQAVNQNVAKDTAGIANQVQQKQSQLNQALSANQQKAQDANQFAENQVNQILAPAQAPAAPQKQQPANTQPAAPYAPSAEDSARFQRLMQGEAGFTNVSNINVTPEQMKLESLQNMAKRSGTDSGRRELLGQTFGKGREYNRGQSGLDALIVGGDAQARQQMAQGTQQAVQGAGDQLQQAYQQGAEGVAADQELRSGLGQNISNIATGGQGTIDAQLEQQRLDAVAQREGYRSSYDKQAAEVKKLQDQFKNASPADIYRMLQGADINRGMSQFEYQTNPNWQGQPGISPGSYVQTGNLGSTIQQLDSLKGRKDSEKITVGQTKDQYGRTVGGQEISVKDYKKQLEKQMGSFDIKTGSKGKIKDLVNNIISDEQAKLLGVNKKDIANSLQMGQGQSIYDIQNAVNSAIAGAKGGYDKTVAKRFGGSDINKILDTSGITKETAANQEQADRYLALQNLMGKQGGMFSGTGLVGTAEQQNKQIKEALAKEKALIKKAK